MISTPLVSFPFCVIFQRKFGGLKGRLENSTFAIILRHAGIPARPSLFDFKCTVAPDGHPRVLVFSIGYAIFSKCLYGFAWMVAILRSLYVFLAQRDLQYVDTLSPPTTHKLLGFAPPQELLSITQHRSGFPALREV